MGGKLALSGGDRAFQGTLPQWPRVQAAEKQAVVELMENGQWWMGEKVAALEQRFAALQGAEFAVACTNGTVALEMALFACGIGAGDEVIVPSYTFVASAAAVCIARAVPVFIDIQADSLNLDHEMIESLITPRTKAIMPVHFCGHGCDMVRIQEIAKRHGLRIIEDAAHCWGATWQDKGLGSFGDAGTFSFQRSKNMTSGEGGLMLTSDPEVAERAWSYHHGGRSHSGLWYDHPLLGTNCRMIEIQAAILLAQLERLESDNLRRCAAANLLDRRLDAIPGYRLSQRDPRCTKRSWHLYDSFFVPEAWGGIDRDRVVEALKAEGVPATVGYIHPLYRNSFLHNYPSGAAGCPFTCPYREESPPNYAELFHPNAERACQTAIWLPQYLLLAAESDIAQVADAFEKVWENRAELR